MSVILLAVSSGVVECISNPTNVEVIIHDYDVEGCDIEDPNFEFGQDGGGDYLIIHFPPEDTSAENKRNQRPRKDR